MSFDMVASGKDARWAPMMVAEPDAGIVGAVVPQIMIDHGATWQESRATIEGYVSGVSTNIAAAAMALRGLSTSDDAFFALQKSLVKAIMPGVEARILRYPLFHFVQPPAPRSAEAPRAPAAGGITTGQKVGIGLGVAALAWAAWKFL